MIVSNRKEIEKLVYDVYAALDPSLNNSDRFSNLFSSMNDIDFCKYMKKFLSSEKERFLLGIIEFEHFLKFEYCEKAAEVLKVPLMEYVYLPHLNKDKENVIITKEKCLVGYINVKRPQQLVHKKNGISISNESVSSLTGQVTRDDKNSRDSDIEAVMLIALGADKILQELHGPKSDDPIMKQQARQSVANKGYILLDELENLPTNKVTLNTVNTFLLSMGLSSDLVTNTDILPKTSKDLFN